MARKRAEGAQCNGSDRGRNGTVHRADALLFAGYASDPLGLDVNDDGKVNDADLTALINNQPPLAPLSPTPADKATTVSLTAKLLVLVIVIESMRDQKGNPWFFLANNLNMSRIRRSPDAQRDTQAIAP